MTPVQQLIEYLERNKLLKLNEITSKSLDDYITDLLEEEKQHLCAFWIEGNTKGWEMQTDWPEDAERFYNEKFLKNTIPHQPIKQ
jgi:hypothetical protein